MSLGSNYIIYERFDTVDFYLVVERIPSIDSLRLVGDADWELMVGRTSKMVVVVGIC